MASAAVPSTDRSQVPAGSPTVQVSRAALWLALLVMVLAAGAAMAGLAWSGGLVSDTVTTARGETVELHGSGLYRYDSRYVGPVHQGTDAVALLLGVPLLAYAALRYRRGSARGAVLLTAVLVWFLYLYLSLALGAAYNELFLVYVLLVAFTSTAVALVAHSIDARALARRLSPRFPRRGVTIFLLIASVGTLLAWGGLAITALVEGGAPAHLGHATTTVEEALSLGLLVPAFILAAILLGRGHTGIGTMLGFPLLMLIAVLAPVVAAQTAFQLRAGVELSTQEMVGLVGIWVLLGLVALVLLVRTLRAIEE